MAGKRGFGGMDPERQRELASQGGKAAHAKGKAYRWNHETAKAAGKLGGAKSRENALRRKQQQSAAVDRDGQAQPGQEGLVGEDARPAAEAE